MTFPDLLLSLKTQLGLMTWPLTVLSFLFLMLFIERSIFFLLNIPFFGINVGKQLAQLEAGDINVIEASGLDLSARRNLLAKSIGIVFQHASSERAIREDCASLWLQEQRVRFVSGLRLMNVIGVVSPLVGLLGTVLGLIEMFKGIGESSGSVTPAELADGLGLAMSTTAAGLLIALPAITFSQLFQLTADRCLTKAEQVMNHVNLTLSSSLNNKHEVSAADLPAQELVEGVG
ncbi:biopolymer transporter ExbB [Veronia nyctiphanis]|uniref:Biopolymer transporter ExbB n=1 Tax=Veronia nyctiphanis TaxID=1278244 RepID=A0A4Q0YW94_9GAMM|nr:MotA/TolQ/ExbB proton channel family protein [Veronia nyctiphanis]RXJ74524.1 biopolymer transporter ExbB [Veronia nyctiphanis]